MPRLTGLELINRLRGFISNHNLRNEKIKFLEPYFVIQSGYSVPALQKHLAGQKITTLYEKPVTIDDAREILSLAAEALQADH